MGILRRTAGDLPPRASDPLEVSGQGTDPAPEDTDNSDIAAKAGGNSLSSRYPGYRGKWAQVTKAVVAAVAVMVVCGARYIMSGRLPSYLKISQLRVDDASRLPLDDASMQKYMNDFNEAAAEMEKALSSGPAMRQAFQLQFTPSLEDGQSLPGDPLEIIKDHVAKMRECKVPSASSPQERRDFAQHLQLLSSICRTSALRLHYLEWFITVYQRLRLANPLPVPGRDEDYSDSDAPIDFEEVTKYDWAASTFLKSFGLFGGDTRQVNETLADKLRSLLDIEKRHNDTNLRARYHFLGFLQPFEGDSAINPAHAPAEHQIPYTGKLFRTGAFAQAAAQIFRESDANTNYAFIRKLNRIADNWTNEGVAAAVKQQAKENAESFQTRLKTKRELMRRLLSQGIPEDDLVYSNVTVVVPTTTPSHPPCFSKWQLCAVSWRKYIPVRLKATVGFECLHSVLYLIMGILRRIAGDLPPKVSDPLEVSGQGTDPAPEDKENSDIAAKAGGASLSKRCRGKWARVTKTAIAAAAVIVVCGARYIMSGRFPSYLKISQLLLDDASRLQLDDVSMEKYMLDFNEAATEMEEALSSGSAMRQAFQLHFTPSLDDSQSLPGDPLEIIRDHVAKMRECEVPSASSPQARRDFAQHLQLLRSICLTVALRLHDLELFNTVNQELGVANPFLVPALEEAYSDTENSIDVPEVTEPGWPASEFLESFGLFGGDTRRVNQSLAEKLGGLLAMEKRFNDANLKTRYHFTAFLQPLEGDGAFNPAHAPAEHQIPYTGKPFRTGALAKAAAHISRESHKTTNYAFMRKLSRTADNWTNEEVVATVRQQEKEDANNAQTRLKTKRELMRRLLKQCIAKDDLVTLLFVRQRSASVVSGLVTVAAVARKLNAVLYLTRFFVGSLPKRKGAPNYQ